MRTHPLGLAGILTLVRTAGGRKWTGAAEGRGIDGAGPPLLTRSPVYVIFSFFRRFAIRGVGWLIAFRRRLAAVLSSFLRIAPSRGERPAPRGPGW